MNRVISADGTSIAFDRLGDGQPVIVVGGILCDRAKTRPLAEELAKHFTVINYDRRGRGDSGDTAPYAIEREIEDLRALVAEVGGTASVYGHSSGAGLVLHAAADGLPAPKVVLHEPPYAPDREEERRFAQEFAANLEPILAQGRRWRGGRTGHDHHHADAAGDRQPDAQRAVVGGDGGDGAHDRLRLRDHGRPQGRHDPDRSAQHGNHLCAGAHVAGRARRG